MPTISLFLPSLDGGGAERVFVQLANEFSALGLSVDMVLAAARGPYLAEVAPGVRIVDLQAPGVLRSLPKLARYLREQRPEALLSALDHANITAIAACKIANTGIRCAISMRSVPSAVYGEEKRALRRWLMPRLMRASYRLADRVIANSQSVAADLLQKIRVPAGKLRVIYNPLDLDSIRRLGGQAIDNEWLKQRDAPLLLAVGRLDVLKDFPTLIRAFAIVRSRCDCRLAILGEGPDRQLLEKLVAELHLSKDVHFTGFINNPFAWMRRADLIVCSSLTEGCPNALMQALACGTAIVSTDCVGGCSEILEGGKWGRLVPIGDVQALADSILATLRGGERPDGRRRAADFAIREIALAYLRQLIRFLDADRGAPIGMCGDRHRDTAAGIELSDAGYFPRRIGTNPPPRAGWIGNLPARESLAGACPPQHSGFIECRVATHEDLDARFVISYNGEIYNFRELAADRKLNDLRSSSDTEVVLRMFADLSNT